MRTIAAGADSWQATTVFFTQDCEWLRSLSPASSQLRKADHNFMLSITHALLGTTDTYTFGLLGHIVTSVEKFLTRLQACGAGGRGGNTLPCCKAVKVQTQPSDEGGSRRKLLSASACQPEMVRNSPLGYRKVATPFKKPFLPVTEKLALQDRPMRSLAKAMFPGGM